MYSSDTPIAGFQFNVTGAIVTGASGGAAEEAGFQLTAGGANNMVIGYSLVAATIPAGCGVLVVLDIDGDASAACIGDVILSDSDANVILQTENTYASISDLDSGEEYCFSVRANSVGL